MCRAINFPLAFKMPIKKVQRETVRLHLQAPPEYLLMLSQYPWIVDEIANGVGSETSCMYHLTPDTAWGLNINPTSHGHDWMYTFPLFFPTVADGLIWKMRADQYFDLNGHIQVADGIAILRPMRRARIDEYTAILMAGCSKAFWENKPLPPDYDAHYTNRPSCDPAKLTRLMEIEQIINDVCPEYIPYNPEPATA